MSEVDRDRLDTLLRSTLDRPPTERNAYLDAVCAGDAALRARLGELICAIEDVTEHGGRDDVAVVPRGSGSGAVDGDRSQPPLVPGQRLGRYEILDLLGAGGMGTVYRALDPSLGREVAIKAIARAFHGDSGSLRRFEREARVLAALSHPNIASIYGFERLDGSPYLVLEHVDGETLAQRIARGPLPLREAVAIALQVVEGLEEAHAKGVVHRDLKPSNVMLAAGGRAKLVDFGLAKTAQARADADVSAEPITAAGAVLGTARYMSPEQVRGDEVDARTDIWAFGCLLFEMLSGRPSFAGRSVPEVLAALLRDEPDWHALPNDVPPDIQRLVRRCLRRDLRLRLQHIGDARLDLVEADAEVQVPLAPRTAASHARRALPWIVAACSIAAVAIMALRRSSTAEGPRPAVRLSLELPAHLTLAPGYATPFAVAPTGASVVIEAAEGATTRLYVRRLGELSVRPLAGTEAAHQPFFSPDGALVGFFANRKLTTVPTAGGQVLPLADIGGNPRGATWAAGGTIVVAPSQTSGLVRVPARGGPVTPLTTLDRARGEYSHRWPAALPGGKWVIFTVGLEDASFDEGRIDAVSLETGERRPLVEGAGFARYVPGGPLMFVRGGRLFAVGFDADRVSVRGSPEVVLDTVRYDPRNGGCHLDVSTSGVIAYVPGLPSSPEHYLAWIDRRGTLQRVVDTPRLFREPRVSPDGKRVAVVVGTSGESDLWQVGANATLSRLTFGLSPHRPAWTPDGAGITVGSERGGAWWLQTIAADGTGSPALLLERAHRLYPNAWSPDGRRLVFQESQPVTGWDLRVLEVDAAGQAIGAPQDLAATPFHETSAVISPDGRWIAYESDELDGIVQVYVRQFPSGAGKVRVSQGGARWPVWGPRGDLFYWHTGAGAMHVAHTRNSGAQLEVTGVEPVWNGGSRQLPALARIVVTVAGARYDVDPPASRFLTLETAADSLSPAFTRPVVVLDWPERAPAR